MRWPCVAVVFFLTIPGLAVSLIVLAALDRLGMWLRSRSGLPWYRDGHRPASAPSFDELQAVLYASNRHTIERRKADLVLRDDAHDVAPPGIHVDLDGRRAVVMRLAAPPSAQG